MKANTLVNSLLLSAPLIAASSLAVAETCYNVSGQVDTTNITQTLQIGNVYIELQQGGNLAFDAEGSITGIITGSDGFLTTYLTHAVKFPQGESFVTENDQATLVFDAYGSPIRKYDDQGNPCSYNMRQTISKISKGNKFFKNTTHVDVIADGWVSYCPDENTNHFELSGTLCVE